jgi:hypothetical protein
MADINFTAMYDELATKFSELFQQRNELELQLGDINKQLESIRETMSHLAPLAGYSAWIEPDTLAHVGITDAARSVLHPANKMSTAEVRAEMEKKGFDFSKYSAPDACIRTVLKRLVDAGKAEQEKEGHKIFYKYIPTDEEIPF